MTVKIDAKSTTKKVKESGLSSGSKGKSTKKYKMSKKEAENYVRESVKSDLLEQLADLDKATAYNKNLIDDYMFYYDLKDKMKRDINRRGLVITATTGNGFKKKEVNENVAEMQKITRLMLKILSDLGLQEPSQNKGLDFNDFM